jgi:3-oxoadipate enol-lactonase
MIGYDAIGKGPHTVFVMNDWRSDTSSWDDARKYLDLQRFRWIFADLRGYGRSKDISGVYTADEAAADILALADSLDLARFSIVGHSMSSMVVMALLRTRQDRIDRAVVVTPPPPSGMAVPQDIIDMVRGMALGDDAARYKGMEWNNAPGLSPQWMQHKIERWRISADSAAVAAYVDMYAGNHPAPARITVPLLALTGELDSEPLRSGPTREAYAPLCEQLEVVGLAQSAHYPMQEMPPLFTSVVQRFLGAGV